MDPAWITVNVHPNAGKDVLIGIGPGRFEAWIKAKPIDGQANHAVAQLLARSLQLSPGAVRLVKGHSSRRKVFKIVT